MIETERLILRRPAPRDLDAFVAYIATPRSAMNGGPLEAPAAWRAFAAHLGGWEINGFGLYAVTVKGDDRIRGLVGHYRPGGWPEPEVGWSLFDPADEGKGLAREAAEAALVQAFGPLGWPTAVSYCAPQNAASRRLAEHLGGRLDPQAPVPPGGKPCVVYRHDAARWAGKDRR